MKNYLTNQYKKNKKFKINHNYLSQQFKNYKTILNKIATVVRRNDFTLGKEVDKFENKIQKLLKSKYIVSVGSGTDALMLSLKALGIREGDEVITTPFTFYATIGAIVTCGAVPKFVDVKDDYNIDEKLIEQAITKKTKAIMPVHWAGRVCEMNKIKKISQKYKLPIVEDSCHAILGKYKDKLAGTFGAYGCFSMHPLKNLNVWGDGGFVICANNSLYKKMKLLRNHGLVDRDKNLIFGYNSRLDTIQAAVANYKMKNKNEDLIDDQTFIPDGVNSDVGYQKRKGKSKGTSTEDMMIYGLIAAVAAGLVLKKLKGGAGKKKKRKNKK